jgi:hypothetical protein
MVRLPSGLRPTIENPVRRREEPAQRFSDSFELERQPERIFDGFGFRTLRTTHEF